MGPADCGRRQVLGSAVSWWTWELDPGPGPSEGRPFRCISGWIWLVGTHRTVGSPVCNFIETATKIMLDAPYQKPEKSEFDIDRIGVKASQFSFARLQNADPVLGVDMSSTGEVGCLGDDLNEALLNSLIATGYSIPKDAVLISSGGAKGKVSLLEPAQQLA